MKWPAPLADAMGGSGGVEAAGLASDAERSVRRVALAFVAGVAVTVLATVLLAALSPFLLPFGAVGGAAAAGYLARIGRVGGTLLGAVVMAAVGAAGLAGFWLVVTADPPRTGGAGLGLVVGFIFLAFFVLVGVVLGGLGGLTGAVVRRRHGRADDAAGAGPARGHEPLEHRDPGRPDAVDECSDTVGQAPDSRDGVDSSVSTIVVGCALTLATCFVPFAPVATGTRVGYLEAAGPKRGAIVAALAGLLATAFLVAGLLLFALLPLNILRPFVFEYFPQLTVILAAYFVGLGAIGGAFGGSVAG